MILAKLKNITFLAYSILDEKSEVLFRGNYDANSIIKREFQRGYELVSISLIENWDKAVKIVDLINLCSFLCSTTDRVLLHHLTIKHLNDTIYYFKKEGGSI